MLSMNALNQIILPILTQSGHFAIGIETNSPSLSLFWGERIAAEEDISGAGIKIHKCFIC